MKGTNTKQLRKLLDVDLSGVSANVYEACRLDVLKTKMSDRDIPIPMEDYDFMEDVMQLGNNLHRAPIDEPPKKKTRSAKTKKKKNAECKQIVSFGEDGTVEADASTPVLVCGEDGAVEADASTTVVVCTEKHENLENNALESSDSRIIDIEGQGNDDRCEESDDVVLTPSCDTVSPIAEISPAITNSNYDGRAMPVDETIKAVDASLTLISGGNDSRGALGIGTSAVYKWDDEVQIDFETDDLIEETCHAISSSVSTSTTVEVVELSTNAKVDTEYLTETTGTILPANVEEEDSDLDLDRKVDSFLESFLSEPMVATEPIRETRAPRRYGIYVPKPVNLVDSPAKFTNKNQSKPLKLIRKVSKNRDYNSGW